jgi:hypothetical protein
MFAATTIYTINADIPAGFTLKQESAHFKVFTQKEDNSVNDVLARAEEIYSQITTHLNFTPGEKMSITIFPNIDAIHQYWESPNAPTFLVNGCNDKGEVFLTSPTNPGPTHTYQSILRVSGATITRAIIKTMPKLHALPTWFILGYSLYESVPPYTQTLSELVKNDQLPSFGSLNDTTKAPTFACARNLVEFLIKRYGMAVIPELVRDFSKFEQIIGFSQETFYTEWLKHIKELYTQK